jgi:hypothetical protein
MEDLEDMNLEMLEALNRRRLLLNFVNGLTSTNDGFRDLDYEFWKNVRAKAGRLLSSFEKLGCI